MGRMQKLIDRRDARKRVAAADEQGCSRAKVDALQDTATTTGTDDSARYFACASAPARGGSNTTASKRASSGPSSGRRNRSRVSMVTVRSPCVWRTARSSANIAAPSDSTAWTVAFSASRSASVPTPAKRSATILALPTAAVTSPPSASSPAIVACRKPPGGGTTSAFPIFTDGVRRSTMTSPCMESRANVELVG